MTFLSINKTSLLTSESIDRLEFASRDETFGRLSQWFRTMLVCHVKARENPLPSLFFGWRTRDIVNIAYIRTRARQDNRRIGNNRERRSGSHHAGTVDAHFRGGQIPCELQPSLRRPSWYLSGRK